MTCCAAVWQELTMAIKTTNRLVAVPRRIEFVILQTDSSLPVALHLALCAVVTFSYGAVAYFCTDFHHADVAPLTGALIPAEAGMQASSAFLGFRLALQLKVKADQPEAEASASLPGMTTVLLGSRRIGIPNR